MYLLTWSHVENMSKILISLTSINLYMVNFRALPGNTMFTVIILLFNFSTEIVKSTS